MIRDWIDKLRTGLRSEHRKRSRVHMGIEAFIEADGVTTPVVTSNLSMNGALCRGLETFSPGSPCSLIIPLAAGVRIAIEGEIVRTTEQGTAIRFESMDPDSFTHLRRMVELNAQDADRIENELRGRDS